MLHRFTPLVARSGQQQLGRFDAYDLIGTALAVGCAALLAVLLLRQPAGRRKIWPASTPVELLVLGLAVGLTMLLLHQAVADGLCHGACWSH